MFLQNIPTNLIMRASFSLITTYRLLLLHINTPDPGEEEVNEAMSGLRNSTKRAEQRVLQEQTWNNCDRRATEQLLSAIYWTVEDKYLLQCYKYHEI